MSRLLVLVLLAAACGDNELPPLAESSVANLCATPRTGVDPFSQAAYPDQQGSVADEKAWVSAWINDLYLWYDEVPSLSANDYDNAVDYFAALKTPVITPSGKPEDQFHFTYDTSFWENLSEAGVLAGYGVEFALLSPAPPRRILVAYSDTPGSTAPLARGAEILTVDGVDVVNGSDVDTLNAGLFPSDVGQVHSFEVLDLGATTTRTVNMTSAAITETPVQNVMTIPTATGVVGYMLFTDHIATAEEELYAAVNQLAADHITDLVLDLRYNGGGYLDIANELVYMIAGATATDGKIFERQEFNDKYPTVNPITGNSLIREFLTTTVGYSGPVGLALPNLNLSRIFVLTGPDTCSASESIMNGLAGVGVKVIQIGSTTCGKPYGFYPQDNCGTTFFAIQFRGVNAMGFGDYADGFSVDGLGGAPNTGCQVGDDFTHALGDPAEARLAGALQYRGDLTCPPVSTFARAESHLLNKPWGLTNAIYGRKR